VLRHRRRRGGRPGRAEAGAAGAAGLQKSAASESRLLISIGPPPPVHGHVRARRPSGFLRECRMSIGKSRYNGSLVIKFISLSYDGMQTATGMHLNFFPPLMLAEGRFVSSKPQAERCKRSAFRGSPSPRSCLEGGDAGFFLSSGVFFSLESQRLSAGDPDSGIRRCPIWPHQGGGDPGRYTCRAPAHHQVMWPHGGGRYDPAKRHRRPSASLRWTAHHQPRQHSQAPPVGDDD